ncbi:MAG: hypothetical protein WCD70_06485 [Alphaproteobacteria bacterium]
MTQANKHGNSWRAVAQITLAVSLIGFFGGAGIATVARINPKELMSVGIMIPEHPAQLAAEQAHYNKLATMITRLTHAVF